MSFSPGLCSPLFVVSFLMKHLVPVLGYSRFHDIDGHIGRLQDESSTWKDAAKTPMVLAKCLTFQCNGIP